MNNKELIIFDLDGTLAESKQPLDPEMSELLSKLLIKYKVAVISGGSYRQFEKQFLPNLNISPENYKKLFLFPTSGNAFYRYENGLWQKIYAHELGPEEKKKIIEVLKYAENKMDFGKERSYGDRIEDRDQQITYSALGQQAPIEVKKIWDPDQEKRKTMILAISPFLCNFGIHIGGMTSIDITRKGIDKAYGINQIEKTLGVSKSNMVFVGDALFPGGNDYPARTTGVECVEVKNVEETKDFIRKLEA